MANSPVVARINALLAEKGISKQSFYSACGITSASYSLWNTGKTQPRMKNLEIIADFLDVPVSYLLEGIADKKFSTENKKSPAPEGAELTPDQIRAIEKIKNMPPDEMAKKIAALEAVLDM